MIFIHTYLYLIYLLCLHDNIKEMIKKVTYKLTELNINYKSIKMMICIQLNKKIILEI